MSMSMVGVVVAVMVGLASVAVAAERATASGKPIALSSENPHYFVFRGKPTVLVSSGEHYGAVLNKDFDEIKYLDKIQSLGFNLTRLFSGTYVEQWGAGWNTLCPSEGKLICPWQRSAVAGYARGGNKFDLGKPDEAYWTRMKGFLQAASERGIVVEYTLFCTSYGGGDWPASPMNAANNVNGLCAQPTQLWDVHNAPVMTVEEAYVRKAAAELNGFDNLYYELCNEPYIATGPGRAWHERMAQVLREAEAGLPKRHLIAHNIANNTAKVDEPVEGVSVLNFHYASPPQAVVDNYGLGLPISFDESGFRGQTAEPYGREAWAFMLAGGAVYDGLDWTFTAEHPDGGDQRCDLKSMRDPALWPQLKALRAFMDSVDVVHMKPDDALITGGVPKGVTVHVLAKRGEAVALFADGGAQVNLKMALPAGTWKATWVDPRTGGVKREATFEQAGGEIVVSSPAYEGCIAARIVRMKK